MLRAIIGFVAVAITAAAIWLYRPLAENPDAETLAAAASNYAVEIIRDQWGVPHITGETDADVSFGLAYAHAEDDFETIQETLAATRGVLARYRGSSVATTDYVSHLLSVWPTVEARFANDVPEDVKAIAAAYVAGLNYYAAQHPDQTWQGLAPFKAEDVIAGFIFKTPFFYGLDDVLLDLFDEHRNIDIALDPAPGEIAWQSRRSSHSEFGSNALAVRAHRSGDGKTRLLINSHQPMTGPVAWYEAHLISQQGLNISGGLFPGTPVVLHGFNDQLGWANTVNHIDLSDSYVLTRNPENELQYRLDGKWVDFEVREVEIEVKLFGPFRYPVKRRLLISRHGPVIESKKASYALRYAGMGEIRQLEQYYRLNRAENIGEFMQAMRMNALPSINYIYADRDDNIA
ncbi:MAG: penicillin acylase family protein, partial [Arenicella sp.]|nr:penicillin acylase family protein [Arenicella sp.]